MIFFDFPYIGNVIIPTYELIFFRGLVVKFYHQPDLVLPGFYFISQIIFRFTRLVNYYCNLPRYIDIL